MHRHLVCLLGWDFHSFDLKHIIGLSDSSSFSYTQLPIYIIVAWPALQYARFNCRERLLQANCSWHWLQILEEVRGQIHGKSGLSGLHLALVATLRPLNCLGGELSKAPRFQIEKPSFTANRNVPFVEGFANKDLSNQKLKLYAMFLYNG